MRVKPGEELPFMIVFSKLSDHLDEFALKEGGSSFADLKTMWK